MPPRSAAPRGKCGSSITSQEKQPLLSHNKEQPPVASTSRTSPTHSRSSSQSRSSSSLARSPLSTNTVTGFKVPTSRPRSSTSSADPKRRQQSFSRSDTPTSSASSSRRSSLVVDSSVYRYSLNVGGVSRFPAASTGDVSGSGANQILAAGRRGSLRIGVDPMSSARSSLTAKEREDRAALMSMDPSLASVSSTSSRASSRRSSRYMAEEVAPTRRPVYLVLPSDPSALGPWSNTQSTVAGNAKDADKDAKPERRDSKIMTSFPFPHPVTPRRRADRTTARNAGTSRLSAINDAWQRLLTAIFAGPYERRLNREEQQDDLITQSIIEDIAERRGPAAVTGGGLPNYGAIPVPKTNTISSTATATGEDNASLDPNDPYGYRRLAGPHLLPSYTTDLVARRRERRRARSRARFQCMALWTIWTVSILLLIIVAVIVFSWYFPNKLDIPNHHDEGDDDDADAIGFKVAIKVAGSAFSAMAHKAASI